MVRPERRLQVLVCWPVSAVAVVGTDCIGKCSSTPGLIEEV